MAGTHHIVDEDGGFFRLDEDASAPRSPEAELLAEAILAELARLRGRAGPVGEEKLRRLRLLAAKGLTGAAPDLAGAVDDLRRDFRYPFVFAAGDDQIALEVPRGATDAQIDFLFQFNDALRLVRKLHQPRPDVARQVWGKVLGLPRALLDRLAPPPPGDKDAGEEAGSNPSRPADLAFQKARARLVRAARFAFPDGGDDRPPNLPLARRLVAEAVKEAILDFGPDARHDHLTDLARAFAGATLLFALAALLLYACWGLLFGSTRTRPDYAHFGFASVAVASLFVGAWLSAAQRLNSSETAAVESVFTENFNSVMRAFVLLGLGVLALVMLHKQVLVVNLGGADSAFSTRMVLSNLAAAIVVGALLGLSERLLPDVLASRSRLLGRQLGAEAVPAAPAPPPPPPRRAPPAERPPAGAPPPEP